VDKAERVGNNSISKYKAAPCRYLGLNPDSPANYLVYIILSEILWKVVVNRNVPDSVPVNRNVPDIVSYMSRTCPGHV
jgi:hypothetical protein